MNGSLVKRLQIANSNATDYRKEMQKFVLMYNVTPHDTTGTPLSELKFNQVIRDKYNNARFRSAIPIITSLINKKEREDRPRRAKENYVSKGDRMSLQNIVRANKLTPTFNPEECNVVDSLGNEVVIGEE